MAAQILAHVTPLDELTPHSYNNLPPWQPNSFLILPPLNEFSPHSYTNLPPLAAQLLAQFTAPPPLSRQITPSLLHHFISLAAQLLHHFTPSEQITPSLL